MLAAEMLMTETQKDPQWTTALSMITFDYSPVVTFSQIKFLKKLQIKKQASKYCMGQREYHNKN